MCGPSKRGGVKPPYMKKLRRCGVGIVWGLKGIAGRLRKRVEN
jgi:hypothetical protein